MNDRKAPKAQNTLDLASEAWNNIPWRKLEKHCFRIQKRIFRASQQGNHRAVQKLQKLLLKSKAAQTLAVRRVTQDNQGKKTAGIDGIKSLQPAERLRLVEQIAPKNWPKKSPPVRRIYIPKPGKNERRPLGIPTLAERARQKLTKYPQLKQAIKSWLQAGAIDNEVFTETPSGTPQGGVISPLLANMALHGVETAIKQAFRPKEEIPQVIRYADDFVVLHPTLEGIKKAQEIATQWLQGVGLELKASKTKITHTLKAVEGQVGFNFLGFTIRQFPVGKTHAGKHKSGKLIGFKTLIKPSKEKVKQHLREISQTIHALRGGPQEKLIAELNPKIAGWSRYYQTVVSKDTYNTCDYGMYYMLQSWVKFRHPQKNVHWRAKKYWKSVGKRQWVFGDEQLKLNNHRDTAIKRHVKVKGAASPYDGNLLYWSQRLANHPMTKGQLAKLLRKQQGKCRWCELTFRDGDQIEIDHITPKR